MKRILTVTALLALVLTLSACRLYNHDYKEDVLEYALIAEDGDLSILDQYPNLEYVDLRGSTCYDEILAYTKAHPDVKVRFSIELGERRFNQDETDITLNCYETDYDILLQNLKYLPNLNHVHLEQVTFTKDQLDVLKNTYPDVNVTYTVKLGDKYYDHTVTELELSHLTTADVEGAINAIALLPDLTNVSLVNSSGDSRLTVADARVLIAAHPNVNFRYEFRLFGQTVSTLTEQLVFNGVSIGDTGLEQIREALTILPNCTYIKLDSCGISDSVMAQFRSENPDIKITWRVFVDKYSMLTDEEVLHMPYTVEDEDLGPLKYCNEVKYLDMVNCKITNINFLAHMPKLECAIFTLTRIDDISPVTNCPNLTWLELANCSLLDNISCLSGMTNLKYLNLSGTKVKDISDLNNLPLERLKCAKSSIGKAALEAFSAKHPNCMVSNKGLAVGYGWRYDDTAQKVPCDYYANMMKVFNYDK